MTSEALPSPAAGTHTSRLLAKARSARTRAGAGLALSALLAAAGVAAVYIGLAQAPVVTWGSIAANLLFWAGMAQGGVVLAASLHLAEARWGRLVERFALALGAFLPLSVLAAACLWLGRSHLFPWVGDRGLSPWLRLPDLVIRDAAALFVMTVLSAAFARAAVRVSRAARPLAIVVVVLFFPSFAMLSVDLGMTPDLRYHSTVYPLTYLSACFFSGLCATAIAVALARRGSVREIIPPKRVLDLGNLVWGFALFVGYLWFCEFLVHWMGNLPDEAGRHLHQWHDWPWRILAWSSLAGAVLVPGLVLFSRGVKRHAGAVALAGASGLIGTQAQRLLDVLPSLPVERGAGSAGIAAGVSLGFAGLFGVCTLLALRRIGPFPTEDPLFVKELAVSEVKA